MAGNVQEHLFAVVVRRGQRDLARVVEPEPPAQEPRLQRRGDEHGDDVALPEVLTQSFGDVDGSPRERTVLGPRDGVLVLDREADAEIVHRRQRPAGDLVEVVVSAAKGFSELDQSGGERCGGSRACLDVGRGEPATAATGIEPREQLFASPIDGVERACGHRRRALATRSFHVSQQLAKAAERHAPTEPGSGALLQAVPLVEDDRIVLRQDAGAVARLQPDREIGEVERVVDDHELGIQRLCARLFRIARRQERTPSARAAVGADGHLGPECRTRLERELGAVAVRRRSDPVLEALVLGGVFSRLEER